MKLTNFRERSEWKNFCTNLSSKNRQKEFFCNRIFSTQINFPYFLQLAHLIGKSLSSPRICYTPVRVRTSYRKCMIKTFNERVSFMNSFWPMRGFNKMIVLPVLWLTVHVHLFIDNVLHNWSYSNRFFCFVLGKWNSDRCDRRRSIFVNEWSTILVCSC